MKRGRDAKREGKKSGKNVLVDRGAGGGGGGGAETTSKLRALSPLTLRATQQRDVDESRGAITGVGGNSATDYRRCCLLHKRRMART